MPQVLERAAMKLPADNRPDWRRERQQQQVFTWEAVHEKHAQDDHRRSQHNAQDQQVALAPDLRLPALAHFICLTGNRKRLCTLETAGNSRSRCAAVLLYSRHN